jgi:hypothetical protein
MRNKILAVLLLFIIGFSLLVWPMHTRAATGVVYLSPSSSSVQVGNTASLALRINPGTTVDGVQATISFDTSTLQETSVDTSSSAFPVTLQKTVSGGTITLALGNLSGGVSSDSLIANLSFTALASSGSSNVTLSGVNATYSGSYTNPSSSNATVNFTAAPSSGGGGGSGSSGGSSGSSGASSGTSKRTTNSSSTPTTTPTNQPTFTPKVTTTLGPVKAQYTKASFIISTNLPAQVALKYGTTKSNLDQITSYTDPGTKNTINLDNTQLIAGTTYYYQVVTKDAAGNMNVGSVESFKTKGFTLKVTVLDNKYQPLSNKTVTLHSTPMTAKTDGNGVATFTNVAPGSHSLIYSAPNSKLYQHDIYVENNVTSSGAIQTADPQTAAIILTGLASASSSNGLRTILSVLVALIGLACLWLLVISTPIHTFIQTKLGGLKSIPRSFATPSNTKPTP